MVCRSLRPRLICLALSALRGAQMFHDQINCHSPLVETATGIIRPEPRRSVWQRMRRAGSLSAKGHGTGTQFGYRMLPGRGPCSEVYGQEE
jgi:hypothetical protein